MTEKEYRSHPAISRSELFLLSESPEKFKYYKDNLQNASPALIFGQLFHKMVLQPQTLWDDFIVMPDINRRTSEGKEIYNNFMEEAKEKIIVTADMFEKCSDMAQAVAQNEFVQKLLAGEKEKEFFWTDELTGEECKCRADVVTNIENANIIVDFKTAMCANTDIFAINAIKHGYDLQAGMYKEGIDKITGKKHMFVFIVVEKEPPYSVNIVNTDELFLRHGYDLFRKYLGIYHDCKQTGNWYGYLGKFNQINTLSLPSFAAKDYE